MLALVVGALAGCATPAVDRGGCVPRFSIEPGVARVGDSLEFSSRDVCAVDVPRTGWRVAILVPGSAEARATVRSTETFDGSWTVRIVVPPGVPAGQASVTITNWDYSSCPDGASCAGPSAEFTVER
ncbi:hypothetical protein GCM10022256_31730 [Frondihabitans peucedani]|uniref:Uncharacterized protein n=2 Tax=Frondihabitans peucedani TaxID=598626 RepID=A0ABP8E5R7_9MICO